MNVVPGLLLSPDDTVVVLLEDGAPGDRVRYSMGEVTSRDAIRAGHKIAIVTVPEGGTVLKYGQPIGLATAPIGVGCHVHVHNLRSARAGAEAA